MITLAPLRAGPGQVDLVSLKIDCHCSPLLRPPDAGENARDKLRQLEQQSLQQHPQFDLFAAPPTLAEPEPVSHPALDELAGIDADELTARQALELVYRLKGLL